jgi:hypothetical protein
MDLAETQQEFLRLINIQIAQKVTQPHREKLLLETAWSPHADNQLMDRLRFNSVRLAVAKEKRSTACLEKGMAWHAQLGVCQFRRKNGGEVVGIRNRTSEGILCIPSGRSSGLICFLPNIRCTPTDRPRGTIGVLASSMGGRLLRPRGEVVHALAGPAAADRRGSPGRSPGRHPRTERPPTRPADALGGRPARRHWRRQTSPRVFRGLTGRDRAILYATAAASGFRVEELASLTPEAFDRFGEVPSVTLRGDVAKNGRLACSPCPRTWPLSCVLTWPTARPVNPFGREHGSKRALPFSAGTCPRLASPT